MADGGIQARYRGGAGIDAIGADLAIDGESLKVVNGNIGGEFGDRCCALADAVAIGLDRRGNSAIGVAQGDIAGNVAIRLLRGEGREQGKIGEIEGEIARWQELLRELQLPVQDIPAHGHMQLGDGRAVFGLHHIGIGVDLLSVETAAGGELCLRRGGIGLARCIDLQRFKCSPGKDCAFGTQGDVEIRCCQRAAGLDCKIGDALRLRRQFFKSGKFTRQAGAQCIVFEADIAGCFDGSRLDDEVFKAGASADGHVDIALEGNGGVELFRKGRWKGSG